MTPSTTALGPVVGFSKAQALQWAGLNGDTLRYWKGILAPIQGRDGRSSRYLLEEIFALAVIARATAQLKVPIQLFGDHADAVFSAAASYVASATAASLMVIGNNEVRFARPDRLPDMEVLAIVRMDMVLSDVKARMTNPSSPPPQRDLFDSVT